MTDNSVPGSTQVKEILEAEYSERVYEVEDGVVWVSGMNSSCSFVAESMAKTLMAHDIPCGLVYDDDATQLGGVQFNYHAE